MGEGAGQGNRRTYNQQELVKRWKGGDDVANASGGNSFKKLVWEGMERDGGHRIKRGFGAGVGRGGVRLLLS